MLELWAQQPKICSCGCPKSAPGPRRAFPSVNASVPLPLSFRSEWGYGLGTLGLLGPATHTHTTPLQIMKPLEMPDLSCHSYDSGKMFSGTPEGEKKGRGVLNRTGKVEEKRMNGS